MTTIPDTPSTHEDSAQAVMLDLRRLTNTIRGLTLLSREDRQKAATRHVDDDFLRAISVMVDVNSQVAGASITGAQIRDHLQFSGSHQGVGDELILQGRKLKDTLLWERLNVGDLALRALKVARAITNPAERAALVPHLEAIEQNYTRGRRKRATTKKPGELTAAAKKAAQSATATTEVKP